MIPLSSYWTFHTPMLLSLSVPSGSRSCLLLLWTVHAVCSHCVLFSPPSLSAFHSHEASVPAHYKKRASFPFSKKGGGGGGREKRVVENHFRVKVNWAWSERPSLFLSFRTAADFKTNFWGPGPPVIANAALHAFSKEGPRALWASEAKEGRINSGLKRSGEQREASGS